MLLDAREQRFDIVPAENVDRLSRDEIESAAALRKRLEFLGIEFHTVVDGRVSELHAGLKGLMSALDVEIGRTHEQEPGCRRERPLHQG